jgi:hypothetical protein
VKDAMWTITLDVPPPKTPCGCAERCTVTDLNSDANRMRILIECHGCMRRFSGCYARRGSDAADAEGLPWGTIGEWTFREFPI